MSRRRTPTIALVSLLLLAAAAEPMPAAAGEEVRQGSSAQVGVPWRGEPGITETVGQIMARDRRNARARPRIVEELPERGPSVPKRHAPAAVESPSTGPRASAAAVPPTPGVSFLAMTLGEALAIPPDTMGSVGPDQILVHTNGRVKLFDKAGAPAPAGTPLNVSANAFWASVRDNKGVSDPHVEYDRLSQRWFLTIINVPRDVNGDPFGPNRVLVAVSDGPSITDGTSFTFFQFQVDDPPPGTDTNRFGDYPTLGVDANAVYIGINMFDQAATFFQNTTAFVINKADLLASTLTVTAFRGLIGASTGIYTPQGVHNQDPAATQGYFIGVDNFDFSELVLRRVTNPGGTPSISGDITVGVPPTAFPMFGVPQPSPGPLLDDIDDRLFAAMIAQDPGGQPRLWTAHNIEVNAAGTASSTGNRDGSRWYEIGDLSGMPTAIQSGTLFDSAVSGPHSYWMPSIAANGQGHAVIGMSRAGANPSGHAGAAVAERLVSDPAGTMSAPLDVQSSTFLYDVGTQNPRRWGDYSQTVIDPNDNMTFWTFQEYTNATNSWGVRVIELKAPPPAEPSAVSPSTVPACSSVDVEVTGISTNGSGFFDPGPDTGGPGFANHIEGAVDGGVTVNAATFTDPTHVTIDVDTSAASAGSKAVTITNPDGQSDSTPALLDVSGTDTTAPAAFNLTGPVDGATVSATPTLTWQASSDTGCGLDKYQLWIDGMLNRDDISPSVTSTTPVAPLSSGAHTWKIVAVDGASPPNSTDSNETRSFTVVDQAPVLANCGGQPATHVGTSGNDTIVGTSGDDVIVTLGGNDTVKSKGGADIVCAGTGNDTVRAGSGNDLVLGQGGKDFLIGQGGKDRVKGGGGRDRIKGGSGPDNLRGQGGNDTVRGQGGADKLNGGPGRDLCNGGAGRDKATACEEEQLIP